MKPIELGRSLNKAEDLRLVADYKSDSIDAEAAHWSVVAAMTLIDEVGQRFLPDDVARRGGDT